MHKTPLSPPPIGSRHGTYTVLKIYTSGRAALRCDCGGTASASARQLAAGLQCGLCRASADVPVTAVFDAIRAGALPPADTLHGADGSPAWTLASVAQMLGLTPSALLGMLPERNNESRHRVGSFSFIA